MRSFIVMSLGAVLVLPEVSAADVLSSQDRVSAFRSQTSVLDTRARQQNGSVISLQPGSVRAPTKWDDTDLPGFDGGYRGDFVPIARVAAQRHDVPVDLFLRLVQQESNWRADAISHKGAIGLAQLMPGTARTLGVNPHDPRENLEGGARYLSAQYRAFGSWRLALAAYNAGPEAVRRYGGVPPFDETRNYVRVIWGS